MQHHGDLEHATGQLGALAHPIRLAIFRHLAKRGKTGLSAGALAMRVSASPSNLSFHVKELANAGLVSHRREGRSILYAIEPDVVRSLIDFLTEDCCGGNPELCGAGAAPARVAVTQSL